MSFETVVDILQIIFADIILSGDNALVIGMAAAGLSPEFRKRAIMIGMMMAAGMRIVFAVIASFLISIKGILLIGGVLLAWVCWRFYKDLKAFNSGEEEGPAEGQAPKKFGAALVTIMLADVSMSLDNVVAVAAIARDDTRLLIFGLALAILIMALFASVIMKVMLAYRWLSYAGLVFLVYLTVMMLYDGARDLGLLAM
uniref:Predicted membrane protein n=1 Tax=uncultured bacterium BAC17H8 TaxID=332980 RepID=Q4JMI0_9BACT|nr:predicted membrane protein [uncultured bacterium BAC17H8]